MAQWNKLLKSLGFTDSETAIYLASLEFGPASVQDLAKKARVSRVTTYAVIEAMTKHGLMSSVEKGKKTHYVAEAPERLLSFVHSRVKSMEATLKEVEGSLEELKLIQRGEKPVVKLFEGPEALKAIEEDVIRTHPAQIEEFGNLDEIVKMYPADQRKEYFEQLVRMHPKIRAMYRATAVKARARLPDMEIVVLPEQFNFNGDIFVYGNKIALSTFRGKQISVLVESKELADTMRAVFEYLWHCAAHLPKK